MPGLRTLTHTGKQMPALTCCIDPPTGKSNDCAASSKQGYRVAYSAFLMGVVRLQTLPVRLTIHVITIESLAFNEVSL